MSEAGAERPSEPIPESAKRYTIVLGIVALLLTVVGFVGAIPAILQANSDAAAQSEGPSAADIPPPDFTIAFIFIGIGVVGLLMLVAWIVLRVRRGS